MLKHEGIVYRNVANDQESFQQIFNYESSCGGKDAHIITVY